MVKYCKLLSQDMTSHNGFKWEIGQWQEITKEGNQMCTDQVFHFYNHPLLAVILNPIHGGIGHPRLFETEIDMVHNTDGLKFACKKQKIVREIDLPALASKQYVEAAIRIALLTCHSPFFEKWANKWYSNKSCSEKSARRVMAKAKDVVDGVMADGWRERDAAWAMKAAAEAALRGGKNHSVAYPAALAIGATRSAWVTPGLTTSSMNFNKHIISIVEKIVKWADQ